MNKELLAQLLFDENKAKNNVDYIKNISGDIKTIQTLCHCFEIDKYLYLNKKSLDNPKIWEEIKNTTGQNVFEIRIDNNFKDVEVELADEELQDELSESTHTVDFVFDIDQSLKSISNIFNSLGVSEEQFEKICLEVEILTLDKKNHSKQIDDFYQHFIQKINPDYLILKQKSKLEKELSKEQIEKKLNTRPKL